MTAAPGDLHAFARQLNEWGAAATAIMPGTKRPAHKWERWQTQPQTGPELDGLPWPSAAAVGVVNGSGDFRIFDIDAVKDDQGRPVAPVPEDVVVALLLALGLPDDYQWSYRSGSGAGFGVVIRCAEALPPEWAATKGVYIGKPQPGRDFGRLELRWSTGQTVIDGRHPSGPGYRWRRGARPFVPPAMRAAEHVIAAFTAIADYAATSEVAPTMPAAANGAAAASGRYATAALIDAIRQVSTTAPGDRNNVLFRQTAGLAELVNGGVLARADVERAMTGAAAGAGLGADETAATIAGAFKKVGPATRPPRSPANGNGGAAWAEPPPARAAGDGGGELTPSSKALPLRDLLAHRFRSQEFLVEGLFAKGHLVVLGGRPKGGKSWLMLQLARCIDSGANFLGRETSKAKVLLYALEDGDRRVQMRAEAIGWQPESAAVLFTIPYLDDGQGGPGPGIAEIWEYTREYDLIVIDTLITAMSGRTDERDNSAMGSLINALAQIAHKSDKAIVVVHHTGKATNPDDIFSTLRGASAIRGGYDVGLILERKPGEREAILHAESRDLDIRNMTLRQADDGAGWDYVGDGHEIEKVRAGRKVLETMLDHDNDEGMTAKQLAEIRKVTEATIGRQLARLEADGYICRDEQPSTQMGKKPDIWRVKAEFR